MNRTTWASLRLALLASVALASLGTAAPASATTPPTIESESATSVTQHSATLSAEINPNGSLTKFKLQIDTSGDYDFYQADCGVLHVPGVAYCQHVTPGEPLPPGLAEPPESSIPAAAGGQEVSVDLASIGATLQPGTTYHYRAIAANGAPVIEGPDQTFTTPSEPAPPSVISESVAGITEHDATLEASINPNGPETSYQFRLESGCLPPLACLAIHVYPLPSGEIPASSEVHPVTLDLNSAGVTLHPDTKYQYSVEATNSAGTTDGHAQTFTTSPASAPSIEAESVSHLTQTDATLEAQINTEGLETTYEFQLMSAPLCLEANPPCERPQYMFALPRGGLLGSFVAQSVSVDLNSAGVSLWRGERYEYWVIATNAAGTTEGPHQTFTVPSEPPPPDAQNSVTGGQLPAIQSPASASSPHHRRHHRRHKRGLHQSKLDRARNPG